MRKKLQLKTETIRVLREEQLSAVGGGAIAEHTILDTNCDTNWPTMGDGPGCVDGTHQADTCAA
jgi:hypothetical protein